MATRIRTIWTGLLFSILAASVTSLMVVADSESNSEKLTTHQTQLDLSNRQLEDFVRFVDEKDTSQPEIISAGFKIGSWSESEKLTVMHCLSLVFHKVPWLIAGPGFRHKLLLARLSATNKLVDFLGTKPISYSAPGVVFLGDRFFEYKNQEHALIHELVHNNDAGCQCAYSPEWAGPVEVLISRLRLRSQMLTPKGWLWYNNYVRDHGIWTGLYGAVNLKEALAEYCTLLIEHDDCTLMPDLRKPALHLLKPTMEELDWRDQVTQGVIQYGCHHYNDAIRFLNVARKTKSSAAINYYLAVSNFQIDKMSDSLELANTSQREFETIDEELLDMIPGEDVLTQLLLLRSRLLYNAGDLQSAKKILDLIIFAHPANSNAIFRRAQCEKEMGLFGAALSDVRLAKIAPKLLIKPLLDVQSEPDIAIRSVEELVRSSHAPETLFCQASFYERLSQQQTNPEQLRKYLQLAENQYEQIAESTGPYAIEALYKCVDLNLDLQEIKKATDFSLKAQQSSDDAIANQIETVKILQATHDDASASDLFAKTSKQIGSEKTASVDYSDLRREVGLESQIRPKELSYEFLEPPSPLLWDRQWLMTPARHP